MRIAIVSDIHGNLTAFEAVIADLRRGTAPDLILHGGDLAHGGARPAEVVDRIRQLGWQGVSGNTDEMLWNPGALREFAAQAPAMKKLFDMTEQMRLATCEWLGEERIEWLKTMPMTERRGEMALVHASPTDGWRGPGRDATDAELRETFGQLNAPVAVYGHIHQPFVREFAELTVANTGSVSLSSDGDPRASYLVVDGRRAEIRRVEYDVERELAAVRRSGLPHGEWVCANLRAGRFVGVD
jgi:putative phosphoesterase